MRMSMRVIVGSIFACVALASTPAYAAGADPGSATPVQREQAQQRFTRGRALFAKKDYAKALEEFVGSYDIVASPNARLYAARCHRELGQLVAAYVELGRAAAEAHELEHEDPRYTKAAEAAKAERDEIAPKLAFVTVSVANAQEQTTLKVGGDEIKRAGWGEPAPVMPGDTEIVVETPGRAPAKTLIAVKAGEQKAVSLDAGGAAPPAVATAPAAAESENGSSSLRTYAFLAGGVGVVGLATFAVAGSMANGTYRDLQDACHGPCPASKSNDISSGKTQQTIANVGLVVGIAGAAAGATLFILSLSKPHAEQSVALAVGPSWMGLRGGF